MRTFVAALTSMILITLAGEASLSTKEVRLSTILPHNCMMQEHSTPHILTEKGALFSVQSPKKKFKKAREGQIWAHWTDGGAHLLLHEAKNCVLRVSFEGVTDRATHRIKGKGSVPFFDTMLLIDDYLYFALDQPYEEEGEEEWADSAASGWYAGDRVMLTELDSSMSRYLIHSKLKEVAEVQFYGVSVSSKVKAVDGERIKLSDGSVWHAFPEMIDRVDSWSKGEHLGTVAWPLGDWFGGESQIEQYEQYIHIALGNPGWDSAHHKEVLIALNLDMDEAAVFWREAQ